MRAVSCSQYVDNKEIRGFPRAHESLALHPDSMKINLATKKSRRKIYEQPEPYPEQPKYFQCLILQRLRWISGIRNTKNVILYCIDKVTE